MTGRLQPMITNSGAKLHEQEYRYSDEFRPLPQTSHPPRQNGPNTIESQRPCDTSRYASVGTSSLATAFAAKESSSSVTAPRSRIFWFPNTTGVTVLRP